MNTVAIKLRLRILWERFVWLVAILFAFLCGLAGVAIFGLQCFHWLRTASWHPTSVLGWFRVLRTEHGRGGFNQMANWADNPVDFLGLHAVIGWVPEPLALFVIAFVFALVADEQNATLKGLRQDLKVQPSPS